ncbi:MAG: glycosyltransferase [Myxococcaceae bacterium]|nr:glycosyltransferase [Myxococcaceae bacterium]
MKVTLFCHSLRSCWNHGNAHFLRGVVSELCSRGHQVDVYEPEDAWSYQNLLREPEGRAALAQVARAYPEVRPIPYRLETLDLDRALDGADLVLVHEWNDRELVRRIGDRRRTGSFRLLFHDTHHRAVTAPEQMAAYDLSHYDGVLAFGEAIRRIYLERGWAQRAFTWHEAADIRVFRAVPTGGEVEDLVWIGNWGDEERTRELHEFLFDPTKALGLTGTVHGVRYPREGVEAVARAGLRFSGWLPNHRVPQAFARARFTVHVPRRPYAEALPGIPTIRVFEALSCAIPLVCAPWEDCERLFTPGEDFLVARNGEQMARHLRMLKHEPEVGAALASHGLATILSRHTCRHRVAELLTIVQSLEPSTRAAQRSPARSLTSPEGAAIE